MNFCNMEHEPAAIAADSPYSVMPSAHAFEPVGGGGGGGGGVAAVPVAAAFPVAAVATASRQPRS